MEVQPDFRDLLASFNAHRVEYAVVGGYALAFHGAPRFTGDLDILVESSPENARRIMQALESLVSHRLDSPAGISRKPAESFNSVYRRYGSIS